MLSLIQKIQNKLSGQRAFSTVEAVCQHHRIQASPGYRVAAQMIKKLAEKQGLNAQIHSFPANNKTKFFSYPSFQEWDCRYAKLEINGEVYADFSVEPLSIVQKSYPCDHEDVEIVYLDQGPDPSLYSEEDLRGKLVFVRDGFPKDYLFAILDYSALGIITDYIPPIPKIRAKEDLADIRNYSSFWWDGNEKEKKPFGFILSPRQANSLQALIEAKQEVKAKCKIEASLYDGEIEVVDIFLPGQSSEEILLLAHLCHPRRSANDNASGVSAGIEALFSLKELIKVGDLEPLERGIRLLLIPEFTGSFAYLDQERDQLSRFIAGLNLDMVGARQNSYYGPINLSDLPYTNPSFVTSLGARILEELSKDYLAHSGVDYVSTFNFATSQYDPGSDHTILSDPSINIHCPMLGQWPDRYYHTSGDTLAVIDPFVLKKSASFAACYAYILANLKEEDQAYILRTMRQRNIEKYNACLDSAKSNSEQARAIYTDYLKEIESFSRFRLEKTKLWQQYKERAGIDFDLVLAELGAKGIERKKLSQKIAKRKYQGPIIRLSDVVRGRSLAKYEQLVQGKDRMRLEMLIQFSIDGKRTVEQIYYDLKARRVDVDLALLEAYLDCLMEAGLIIYQGEQISI